MTKKRIRLLFKGDKEDWYSLLRNVLLVLFIGSLFLVSMISFRVMVNDNREYLQNVVANLGVAYPSNFTKSTYGWHSPSGGYFVVKTRMGFVNREEYYVLRTALHEIGHYVFDFLLGDEDRSLWCDEYRNVSVPGYKRVLWCTEHYARWYADKNLRLLYGDVIVDRVNALELV